MKNPSYFISIAIGVFLASGTVSSAVLTFDDLSSGDNISGTNYAGLTWEQGNSAYGGNDGYWLSASTGSSYPFSGKNVTNAWGSTLLGISFSEDVNISGAYFAGQGAIGSWTTGVRVLGYLDGVHTETTAWFNDIDASADWFAINLNNVDRIVIEAVGVDYGDEYYPIPNGAGWYGMDNLTYSVVPIPAAVWLFGSALAGLGWLRRKQTV
jgi:hypothetical protein